MRTAEDVLREHFTELCGRVDKLLGGRNAIIGGFVPDREEFFVHYHTKKKNGESKFRASTSENSFLEAVARLCEIDKPKQKYRASVIDDWLSDGNSLIWMREQFSYIKLVEGDDPKFNSVAMTANGESSYAALSHLTRREPFLPKLPKFSSNLF